MISAFSSFTDLKKRFLTINRDFRDIRVATDVEGVRRRIWARYFAVDLHPNGFHVVINRGRFQLPHDLQNILHDVLLGFHLRSGIELLAVRRQENLQNEVQNLLVGEMIMRFSVDAHVEHQRRELLEEENQKLALRLSLVSFAYYGNALVRD